MDKQKLRDILDILEGFDQITALQATTTDQLWNRVHFPLKRHIYYQQA